VLTNSSRSSLHARERSLTQHRLPGRSGLRLAGSLCGPDKEPSVRQWRIDCGDVAPPIKDVRLLRVGTDERSASGRKLSAVLLQIGHVIHRVGLVCGLGEVRIDRRSTNPFVDPCVQRFGRPPFLRCRHGVACGVGDQTTRTHHRNRQRVVACGLIPNPRSGSEGRANGGRNGTIGSGHRSEAKTQRSGRHPVAARKGRKREKRGCRQGQERRRPGAIEDFVEMRGLCRPGAEQR